MSRCVSWVLRCSRKLTKPKARVMGISDSVRSTSNSLKVVADIMSGGRPWEIVSLIWGIWGDSWIGSVKTELDFLTLCWNLGIVCWIGKHQHYPCWELVSEHQKQISYPKPSTSHPFSSHSDVDATFEKRIKVVRHGNSFSHVLPLGLCPQGLCPPEHSPGTSAGRWAQHAILTYPDIGSSSMPNLSAEPSCSSCSCESMSAATLQKGNLRVNTPKPNPAQTLP